MRTSCVQDIENISSCEFYVFPVVPNKLRKVMKYEAKKIMLIFLETLNIEWGQIDPKSNRRVKLNRTNKHIYKYYSSCYFQYPMELYDIIHTCIDMIQVVGGCPVAKIFCATV